ncbi:MAG: energy-coupling factor transporter ATPase [Acholeplasmataceae bacterium]|jgi:energy-coupling factor transport system ATP-binding protein|nr:energy-coupling factor transporter ATPase [Acholeplasmataceae bacterium]MDY0338558.1 energy-coupling factor transporter ATPase [Acholeplasmataceae bacterium]
MIKIEGVSFSYNRRDDALSEVSLDIEKGSWTSILGHNGSGKSTLSKLMVGLLSPSKGSIMIDGLVLNEENLSKIRKKIGIVFQNPDNQFVGVTVKHDIAFGLENQCIPHDEMKQKIMQYAKLVNMEDFLDKEPHQLSGGQKQRVAIAGALAMEQDILILDEATSMLDPEGTLEIIELIKHLNKHLNKTIITITHDLSFAAQSDHLIVLKDGKVILEGLPKDVFKEEDLLKSSHLELPFELAIFNELVRQKPEDKKLLEALWAYNSKM